MKIYVAGPYGRRSGLTEAECQHNVDQAVLVARSLILKGHVPFVPHLYHYVHKGWEETPDEDTWWDICATWLEECGALYLLPGWHKSIGTLKELELWLKIAEYRPAPAAVYTSLYQVHNIGAKIHEGREVRTARY